MLKKCPKCGGTTLAPIKYCISVTDETQQRVANKEIFFVKESASENSPMYHCFDCNKNIGRPPIIVSKYGSEDYRNIITAVHFTDGGYFGGYDMVHIQKLKDKIVVEVGFADISLQPPQEALNAKYEITEKRWDRLLERLFCTLYVHEWKKSYIAHDVCDGENWGLGFRLTHGRTHNWGGSNAFPPYWKELKRTFKAFIDKKKEQLIIPEKLFPTIQGGVCT